MHSDNPDNASENDLYAVWLDSVGPDRIAVIAAVRELTGLPHGDAKALVDSAPVAIATQISKDTADWAKARLEQARAQASVRPS
ncbi:ribosomal protein L7/L12 [Pseudomonas promysalinigenes]|uniref:ribosomal protein L7/L12 n=1 Tax=Pseudomonas promysalinigenes TaxID=485898 RepID=UPI0037CB6CF2